MVNGEGVQLCLVRACSSCLRLCFAEKCHFLPTIVMYIICLYHANTIKEHFQVSHAFGNISVFLFELMEVSELGCMRPIFRDTE